MPGRLVDVIETADTVAISAISCWELAQLVKCQRIVLSCAVDEWVQKALAPDIRVIAIDRDIALKAASLVEHHRDPADRLIIATTLVHQASLVSLDAVFPSYVELQGRLIS